MDTQGFGTPQDAFQTFFFFAAVLCIALSLWLRHQRLKEEKLNTPFLQKKRVAVEIVDVKDLSRDTKRIRVSLGSEQQLLGLPTGKHIQIFLPNPASCLSSGTWNGKPDPDKGKEEIHRTYTPITGNETRGYVDFCVKVYRPGEVTMPDGSKVNWADGGKCSCFLADKQVGDKIELFGPTGVHEYLGQGTFKMPGRTATATDVGMLAGGAGLTPMLQVVQAALRDPSDTVKFTLLYANKTEDDILCRDLLEEAAKNSQGRFKIHYTLDFPPEGWKHEKGFITADMIKRLMPPAAESTMMLMCGPPPMVEFACKKNLEELGYPKSAMMAF